MRRHHLIIALTVLLPALASYTQSGSSSAVGRRVAPGIEVLFSQTGHNTCTWRFRNTDPTRTLGSMRFKYTWSASPLSRVPQSNSTSNSNEDMLTEPLQPFEESSTTEVYRAPAACVTVHISVTATNWM